MSRSRRGSGPLARSTLALIPVLVAATPLLARPEVALGATARQQAEPPVIIGLEASPGALEEGGLVDLVASVAAEDPSALTFRWDFGDGTDPVEAPGVAAVRHRYRNGDAGGSVYTVALRVTNADGVSAERSIPVSVANVPPEIVSLDREGAGLENAPMHFEAGARDPGADDQLVFSWSFGDGSTAHGRRVEHRYQSTGTHTVTLRVDDGDGGDDERSMTVMIGEGGQLSVSGDVSIPAMDLTFSSVAGAVAANGMCQVRIQMNVEDQAGLGLQVVLPEGLGKGTFAVGRSTEHAGQWSDEFASPGTFTAGLGVDGQHHPPQRGLFGFYSLGGSVTVEHFDGQRLEMSYALTLRERTVPSADPPPATAHASGWLAKPVGSSLMKVGAIPGSFYVCGVGTRTPMRVTEISPAEDAVNVDLEEPGIEVRFDASVDETSLHDGTFRLEYRLPDEGLSGAEYERVDGVLEPLGERRYRFRPVAPLLDGMIYQATVAGGEAGVKGAGGELLEADRSWRFSTLVEPEAVRLAVFQVARNAPLVPEKTTLARVYIDWREKDYVHPDWQVVEFPARVDVRVNGAGVGAWPFADEVVTRPDRLSSNDSAHALNSVNFFGWEPTGTGGTSRFRATVEPLDQQVDEPRRFESAPLDLDHHTAAPRLTYDARRLLVRAWSDGIPATARSGIAGVLREGREFTIQNLPIVDVTGTAADLVVEEPFMLGWETGDDVNVAVGAWGFAGLDDVLAKQAYDMIAADLRADMVILFFPKEVQPTATGFAYPGFPTRTISIFLPDEVSEAAHDVFASTVAHEFGHAFGLSHLSDCPLRGGDVVGCVAGGKEASDPIEGFRLAPDGAGGRNKSKTEGNEEAPNSRFVLSLMHPDAFGSRNQFIRNDQYLELLEHPALSAGFSGSQPEEASTGHPGPPGPWGPPSLSASALARRPATASTPFSTMRTTASWPMPPSGPSATEPWVPARPGRAAAPEGPQTAPWLLVSGWIAPDGGRAALDPVRVVEGRPRGRGGDGTYTLEVLDAAGAVLRTESFGTVPTAPTHVLNDEGHLQEAAAQDGPGGWFWVAVPRSDAARSVVVRSGDRVLMRLAHTPSAPTVRFEEPVAVESGGMRIAWSGSDADGDPVGYALEYSPDGETGWRYLTPPWSGATTFPLDPAMLTGAPRPTLRVFATDGFREGEAVMAVPRGGPGA